MLGVAAAVGFLTLLGSTGSPAVDATIGGIRPVDEQSIALVAAAQSVSPTIRALLDELSRSDVVVYVRFSVALLPPRAATALVNASGSPRFVAISMSQPNPLPVAIEMLGHELAHAVEIARNPSIRDLASLETFYRSFGRPNSSGRGFDSAEAVRTQLKVRREIG